MVTLGAGLVGDQAAVKPALYGLLSPATTVIRNDGGHWTGGFDYETIECGAGSKLHSICSGTASVTAIAPSGGALYRKYLPFGVETNFKCSSMGTRPDEVREVAGDYIDAITQKSAELEFWTGRLAKAAAADASWNVGVDGAYPNRYLASTSAVDVTPTPGTGIRAKQALSRLEGALASTGVGIQGTIHATVETASVLGLKDKNGALVTTLGNTVVAGSGYTGSGPDGTLPATGKVWMYATGPVTVRVSDPVITPDKVSQSVDIANNTIQYYAESVVAPTFNSCAHFAVLVDLSLDYA